MSGRGRLMSLFFFFFGSRQFGVSTTWKNFWFDWLLLICFLDIFAIKLVNKLVRTTENQKKKNFSALASQKNALKLKLKINTLKLILIVINIMRVLKNFFLYLKKIKIKKKTTTTIETTENLIIFKWILLLHCSDFSGMVFLLVSTKIFIFSDFYFSVECRQNHNLFEFSTPPQPRINSTIYMS